MGFKNQSFQTYLILIYYDNNGKLKVEKNNIYKYCIDWEDKTKEHDMDQCEIGLNPTNSNEKTPGLLKRTG